MHSPLDSPADASPHPVLFLAPCGPWPCPALPIPQDPEYVFSFPEPEGNAAPPIIAFNDVSFGYPGGPTLFRWGGGPARRCTCQRSKPPQAHTASSLYHYAVPLHYSARCKTHPDGPSPVAPSPQGPQLRVGP